MFLASQRNVTMFTFEAKKVTHSIQVNSEFLKFFQPQLRCCTHGTSELWLHFNLALLRNCPSVSHCCASEQIAAVYFSRYRAEYPEIMTESFYFLTSLSGRGSMNEPKPLL